LAAYCPLALLVFSNSPNNQNLQKKFKQSYSNSKPPATVNKLDAPAPHAFHYRSSNSMNSIIAACTPGFTLLSAFVFRPASLLLTKINEITKSSKIKNHCIKFNEPSLSAGIQLLLHIN
jgi:hypothetical protein